MMATSDIHEVVQVLQEATELGVRAGLEIGTLNEYSLAAVGELLEDLGNRYLDIADDIRARIMVRGNSPEASQPSRPQKNPS